MKNINTLIPDIYDLLNRKDAIVETSRTNVISSVYEGLQRKKEEAPRLRLSQMGPRCPRALWYAQHHPELAEKLPPWAQMKYLYGHIIEALVIELAKASGHEVTGEQNEVSVDGVLGHRDCVIDGYVVDVKSSSSRGFQKFKDGSIKEDDPFGYLDQLDGYLVGSLTDSLVKVKDKGYLLAVDKTLGHMVLLPHEIRENHIRSRIADYKRIVELTIPPSCTCGTRPVGESGNIGLDIKASYSLYKYCCFPQLRVFKYKDRDGFRLVHLTKVVREPDVPELRRAAN